MPAIASLRQRRKRAALLAALLAALVAAAWARPARDAQAISVLLCATNDATPPAKYTAQYYADLIYERGKGGLADYWDAVSYGNYNNVGSTVRDWVTMPFTAAQELCPQSCIDDNQCNKACDLGTAWPDCHRCIRFTRATHCEQAHQRAGYSVPAGSLRLFVVHPALDFWGSSGYGAYMGFDQVSVTGLAHELGHGIRLQHSFSNDPNYRNTDGATPGEYDDPWDMMSAFNVYTINSPLGGLAGPSLIAYHMERMGWLPWPYIYTMGARGETSAKVLIKATNAFAPVKPSFMLPTWNTRGNVFPPAGRSVCEDGLGDGTVGAAAAALPPEFAQRRAAGTDGADCPGGFCPSSHFGRPGPDTIAASAAAAAAPAAQPAAQPAGGTEPDDYYLMVRVPFDGKDPNHYLTVEYRRKQGYDAGIPADKQVLIHEIKPLYNAAGQYQCHVAYLLRDLKKPGKPPATAWTVTLDGVTVRVKVAPASDPDYATVTVSSDFSRRCQQGFVWRQACAGDYVCVDPAERAANRAANAAPNFDGTRCTQGTYPRLACGALDARVCVSKAAKARVSADNAAAPGRVNNLAAATYGPNTCKPGFVWRQADAFDYVCVLPESRAAVWQANSNRWLSFDPAATPKSEYGEFMCRVGLVWRGAFFYDLTCVDASVRTAVTEENSKSEERLLNVLA
ncbi:hypothetical protein HT031_000720 [Scenedesmus sp. PABB004]|nr:hypothetical protein HT031_000720 [Scenedesmus sp. PABB004]